MAIKLIKSTFYNEKETKAALSKFIAKSKRLSFGAECQKFEKNFSEWQGRKYATMVNSGSSANLALIQALVNLGRLSKGDRVGFSAVTWSTNVMPLLSLGLEPIPIDVEKTTLNVSPQKLEEAYRKDKFKCLFLTNLLGYSDDILSIKSFCKKNDILLIEDNCEALGSEYKGIKLGNFGLASTFSFFVGHHLSTIEGGMICTNDRELDTMIKLVRAHGWDRNLDEAEQRRLRKNFKVDAFYGQYSFYDIGYNLRPTEIQGFLGVNQLRYADKIIQKREANYKELITIYSNDDFIPIESEGLSKVSNFAFPLVCKTKAAVDHYKGAAKKVGIEIRPIVGGNMSNQVFFKKHVTKKYSLPNADHIHRFGFYFGNNPEMSEREIRLLLRTFSK